MEIIPVIDLMQGQVVHARFGQRQHYQAIQSTLTDSSLPLDIVAALLELYPFKRLYVADLDAIRGLGTHLTTIVEIAAHYPHLEIWLDAGISNVESLVIWQGLTLTHVIGSENLSSCIDLAAISRQLQGNMVFSLDFNQSGFLGCAELQTNTAHWPNKIVVMTLTQVGSQLGPAIDQLQSVMRMAQGRQIYAAGGIRNNADLELLQTANISGALVATALHNKNLTPAICTIDALPAC
jgi:phosphoribosylformimino-5-aminoimidazole carboxamide ribotide isomerase